MNRRRASLTAFTVTLLFAGAADGIMDVLEPVGFLLVGAAVMGAAWSLIEYKEAER